MEHLRHFLSLYSILNVRNLGLAAFRENFVKPGIFSVEDSRGYGEAFELRNVTDYETLGKAEEVQARTTVENASRFFEHVKCIYQ